MISLEKSVCSEDKSHTHTLEKISFLPLSACSRIGNNLRSISVICLMNWAKSKYNNPGKIYDRALVILLMTSLMKVASLQNSGYSLCLSGYSLCRVGMAWGDKPSTCLTGNSSAHWLASWLCGDTLQDWCVFLTMAIYIVRCCLQYEGESHLAEQFPHPAWSFCFILPAQIIFREIALLLNCTELCHILSQI